MSDFNPNSNLPTIPTQQPQGLSGDALRATIHVPNPSASNREVELQNFVRILFKYRILIGGVSVFSVVLAVLYALLATPLYTAEVSLKVGVYQPVIPGAESERSYLMQTTEADYFNTQAEMLTSLSLVDRVLADPEVEAELNQVLKRSPGLIPTVVKAVKGIFSSPGFEVRDETYHHSLPMMNDYLSLIRIAPVRKTSIIRVSAITDSPRLSQKIANAHARAYIEFVREQRQLHTMDTIVFLKGQAEELAQKVALIEKNIASYAEENQIVALNADENITVKRMGELNQLLTEATAKRIKSEAIYRSTRSAGTLNSTAYGDDSVSRVKEQLEKAESEHASLSQKFKPAFPRMVQLQGQIDQLRSQLNAEKNRAVTSLEAVFQADQKSEEELRKQLELQKSKTFDLSRSQVQYNIMKREYDSLRDLHQAVLRELKQAQMNSQNVSTNVTLIDQAPLPNRPSSPRRFFTLMLALLVGPVLGIVLALVAELMDNTLKTPEEVNRIMNLPALGVVPSFVAEREAPRAQQAIELSETQALPNGALQVPATSDLPGLTPTQRTETLNENLITVNLPRSISSEAYRTIRTGILLSAAGRPPRVLLVTSAKKGEGKTTMASNLAVTLAQAGKRTVVIDADLRRPSLSKYFGGTRHNKGLVNFLTGQCELEDIIYSTPVDGLYLISSGPIPPNPAELIGSARMAELIVQLSQLVDHVVIDASPVLPVTDPAILSKMVDGVILVVRAHETKRQPAREASRRLQTVGAKVLGVVLNDVDINSGDYFYYYRDTYSYYLPDEERKTKKRRWRQGAGLHS